MLIRIIKSNKILYRIAWKLYEMSRYFVGVYLRMAIFYVALAGRKLKIPMFYNKYKKIEDLKNRYEGKRCFVIATGPSLKLEDVEMLDGEITFAVNSIFKLFSKTDWRPTHYVMGDFYLYKEYIKQQIKMEFDNFCEKESFLSHPFWKAVKNNENAQKAVVIPVCYYDHWYEDDSKHYHYSDDLMYGIKDLYMVAIYAVNIAQYMGIKEVYLLGTDCDYGGNIKHFGDDEKKIDTIIAQDHKKQEMKQMKAWKFLKSEMEKRNIKVYNATRGGKLEVFERVNLDDVISKKEVAK